jgi:hypothetical protein
MYSCVSTTAHLQLCYFTRDIAATNAIPANLTTTNYRCEVGYGIHFPLFVECSFVSCYSMVVIQKYNEESGQIFRRHMASCPRCARKFEPNRLAPHLRGCHFDIPLHIAAPIRDVLVPQAKPVWPPPPKPKMRPEVNPQLEAMGAKMVLTSKKEALATANLRRLQSTSLSRTGGIKETKDETVASPPSSAASQSQSTSMKQLSATMDKSGASSVEPTVLEASASSSPSTVAPFTNTNVDQSVSLTFGAVTRILAMRNRRVAAGHAPTTVAPPLLPPSTLSSSSTPSPTSSASPTTVTPFSALDRAASLRRQRLNRERSLLSAPSSVASQSSTVPTSVALPLPSSSSMPSPTLSSPPSVLPRSVSTTMAAASQPIVKVPSPRSKGKL